MNYQRLNYLIYRVFIFIFILYLLLPLFFMGVAAFNDSRFPTVYPWQGFTWKWFYGENDRGVLTGFLQDESLLTSLQNSLLIGGGVLLLSIPLGLSAALLLKTMKTERARWMYAVLMSPILTPGVIIGISTLVFWNMYLEAEGGVFLAIIGQSTYISAFSMMLFSARLERFEWQQYEAAINLGATQWQAFRKVLFPFLVPALYSAIVIGFLQSFENYNTTLFVIGAEETLTTNLAARTRLGLTPAINALAVILILLTILGTILSVWLKQRDLKGRMNAT